MRWLYLALLGMLVSFPARSCVWRMGVETSFAPYIVQQGDSWRGLNVDLLSALAAEMGCKLEFIHSPWLRALKLMEQGQLDVVTHLTYNTERSRQFAFIGPHHQEVIYLVGKRQAFPNLTELSELKLSGTTGIIALLNGAYYGDELESILNDAKNRTHFVFIRGNQDKQALLLNGRVHGVLEDVAAFHYWKKLTSLPTADYQPLFEVFQSPVYFGFNLNTFDAQQLSMMADAWQKLYDNGTLKQVMQPYHLDDYQFSLPAPQPKLAP